MDTYVRENKIWAILTRPPNMHLQLFILLAIVAMAACMTFSALKCTPLTTRKERRVRWIGVAAAWMLVALFIVLRIRQVSKAHSYEIEDSSLDHQGHGDFRSFAPPPHFMFQD
jgi:hypothetical protein